MSHFTYVYDGWKLIDEPRHDEKEAERLLASGLTALSLSIEEIPLLKQNDSRKRGASLAHQEQLHRPGCLDPEAPCYGVSFQYHSGREEVSESLDFRSNQVSEPNDEMRGLTPFKEIDKNMKILANSQYVLFMKISVLPIYGTNSLFFSFVFFLTIAIVTVSCSCQIGAASQLM